MKACTKCQVHKESAEFSARKKSPDGLAYVCKACHNSWQDKNKAYRLSYYAAYDLSRCEARKVVYQSDKSRHAARSKVWHRNNLAKHAAKQAKRRASLLKQTPPWADLGAIQKFYLNCPKGFHVDHVVPLKGKEVRGLHTLENLQYLPASINLSKGNRL